MAWLLLLALALEDEEALRRTDQFPPPAVVAAWCEFNGAYRQHLLAEMEVEPWDTPRAAWLRLAHTEAFDLWWTWDCLRCGGTWLRTLRERIGPDAYRAGRLPCPVPLWRFREVD